MRLKLLVLLDACPPEYMSLFRKYFASADLELIPLSGIGNRKTFSLQMRLLQEQNYSELVYFSEDDYFYLPGQFSSMIRFMQTSGDVGFATPYDHLDYYNTALHRYATQTRTVEERQWRTVASTCLTFLTSKSVLRETQRVFNSYGSIPGNSDAGLWFSLTKLKVRNPLTLLNGIAGEPLVVSVMARAWYFAWRQVLFGKRWNLWAPAPTIATHMDARLLPPGYDWESILEHASKSIP